MLTLVEELSVSRVNVGNMADQRLPFSPDQCPIPWSRGGSTPVQVVCDAVDPGSQGLACLLPGSLGQLLVDSWMLKE